MSTIKENKELKKQLLLCVLPRLLIIEMDKYNIKTILTIEQSLISIFNPKYNKDK